MLLMSMGLKGFLTVLIVTHITLVERVERLQYVLNIDIFNAMSKGSKDYVMYTIWIHLMLCQKGRKIMLC